MNNTTALLFFGFAVIERRLYQSVICITAMFLVFAVILIEVYQVCHHHCNNFFGASIF